MAQSPLVCRFYFIALVSWLTALSLLILLRPLICHYLRLLKLSRLIFLPLSAEGRRKPRRRWQRGRRRTRHQPSIPSSPCVTSGRLGGQRESNTLAATGVPPLPRTATRIGPRLGSHLPAVDNSQIHLFYAQKCRLFTVCAFTWVYAQSR